MSNRLSIVIPAFNEEAFIGGLLKKIEMVDVGQAAFEKEVIVVDDCSTDRTDEIVHGFPEVKYLRQPQNQGKGAAVRRGIEESTGNWILVQDADLEYNPDDYLPMLRAIEPGVSCTIYGSRTLGQMRPGARRGWLPGRHPQQSIGPWAAGLLLSFWTWLLFGRWITDTLTAYKLYPAEKVKALPTETRGFETDHELTAKLLRTGTKIIEVPIDYVPRSKSEGKKIKAKDFFIALWVLWKYRWKRLA